jgi:hypothetical protein
VLIAFEARQEASPYQRGFARPRSPEQQKQACRTLRATRIESLGQPTDIVIATEIDRGIGLVERQQAGERRPPGIPRELRLRIERYAAQFLRQPLQPAVAILRQIEILNVLGDISLAPGRFDNGKDRLAESPRLGEFDKAPFAVEPVFGEDQDDRLGANQFAVKLLFPVGAGRNAAMLVDIQEGLIKALGAQPGDQSLGLIDIQAGMADKNPGQRRSPMTSS